MTNTHLIYLTSGLAILLVFIHYSLFSRSRHTMPITKRKVLITGCSDGGLGSALAVAFHKAGHHVYATARDPSKMEQLKSLGIETLTLDVLSDISISACVSQLERLDILVNNAGAGYSSAVVDMNIVEVKKLFDLNVFSYISMTQAFLPLLLKSKGMIVNQTSVAAYLAPPFQTAYGASKAAIGLISDGMRLELEPFDIKVVDLKTGAVKSKFFKNNLAENRAVLPKGSIYEPARELIERSLRRGDFEGMGTDADKWAAEVVQKLLQTKPPLVIWKGKKATLARFGGVMPVGMLDGEVKKITYLDKIGAKLRK